MEIYMKVEPGEYCNSVWRSSNWRHKDYKDDREEEKIEEWRRIVVEANRHR